MKILGIDPGASGGLAWIDTIDDVMHACKMPKTNRDLYEKIMEIAPDKCLLENVGNTYVSGDAATSSVKFALHRGALDMCLVALSIPYDTVTPVTWMKAFVGTLPKANKKEGEKRATREELNRVKKLRKLKIKDKAQQLFPHLRVTLDTADALGIAWYGYSALKAAPSPPPLPVF